jgi:hypothetical protein
MIDITRGTDHGQGVLCAHRISTVSYEMHFHLRTILDEGDASALFARIDRLEPARPRLWGRMNAHQAVCHLNDSLKATLGDRPIAPHRVGLKRKLLRFIGFTLPFPWPRGRVPTSRETDQLRDGTQPTVFSDDVAELKSLLARVRSSGARGLPRHYAWGDLSPAMLGRYVFRHVDHHLRQFGV